MAIKLSALQENAIKDIKEWYRARRAKTVHEFYLAGYAGSGKTTIAEIVIDIIERQLGRKINVCLAAYTGKAADVLRRKTGRDTTTLHRLLFKAITDEEGYIKFVPNLDSALENADLLILDESSMVPEEIANLVRKFCIPTLILGDPAQLPPIIGQSPFTQGSPDFFLSEIHRQAETNPIIRLSQMAREGKPIPFGSFGQGVERVRYTPDAAVHLLDTNTQVICGLNKRRWKATGFIRQERGFSGFWPMSGEPVVGCRNEHEKHFYNGTQAIVENVIQAENNFARMEIRLEEGSLLKLKIRPEPFIEHQTMLPKSIPAEARHKRSSVLDFSYVISCHKAQGSAWPRVVVLNDERYFKEDRQRWLYTALTRAEQSLVIIG